MGVALSESWSKHRRNKEEEAAVACWRGIRLCCHGQISTKETNQPSSVPSAAASWHPGKGCVCLEGWGGLSRSWVDSVMIYLYQSAV